MGDIDSTTLRRFTGDYVLDPEHTWIGFAVGTMLVATVRGQFEEYTARAHLDGDDPSKSRDRPTIRATSIQTGNPRRDKHLRDAFLDVDNHPTVAFTVTAVQSVPPTTFRVTGDLTIRGRTRPTTVDLTLASAGTGERLRFQGTAAISRKVWGVRWNSVLECGGLVVADQVTLEFDVSAVRPS